MNDQPKMSECEEIELLLPWYETGQLTDEETRRVETYLARNPELGEQLALVREEAEETIAVNESLGVPSHAARDRLMERIHAEGGETNKIAGMINGWMKRFSLAGLSPGLFLAGALAAIVIVVQGAVLISLLSSGDVQNGGPKLASGSSEVTVRTGTYVLIRFQNEASAEDITALFRKTGMVIVDGPKPGGMFRVRISAKALKAEDRDAFIVDLRRRTDLVAFVTLTR